MLYVSCLSLAVIFYDLLVTSVQLFTREFKLGNRDLEVCKELYLNCLFFSSHADLHSA